MWQSDYVHLGWHRLSDGEKLKLMPASLYDWPASFLSEGTKMTTVRYTVLNGDVKSEKRNGVVHSYVPDPLGSTAAMVDGNQTVSDTFRYWPYGETQNHTGLTATPFQFVGTAGYYRDTSSRTYVRARHLDMAKGRWLTKDPIGFHGGRLEHVLLY